MYPSDLRLKVLCSRVSYHLVVMSSARIDVKQPRIRNMTAYLLPLPDKKLMTAVVKRDEMSGLDRNARFLSEKVQ